MSANIVGITYEAIATSRLDQIKSAMDAVIAAEETFMLPVLKSLFVIFAGRQFLLTMLGHMTVERFFSSIIRVGIVTLLITHSDQFIERVRDPMFTAIPQAIGNMVVGAGGAGVGTSNSQSLAQQFDAVSAAADALTALTVSRNTSWSVSAFVNSASAWLADGGMQFTLAVIVSIWLLGQSLLAIILCFGPLLLGFELFDRTRGWVDQWIGKLVGMTCFGLGTSILLAIQMQGLTSLMLNAHDGLPTSGAAAVGTMLHVFCNIVIDAFTMAALPLICSIGSGVAASLAAPSALAAMRGLSMGGGAVGRAASGAGRAAAAAAGTGRGNSVTSS